VQIQEHQARHQVGLSPAPEKVVDGLHAVAGYDDLIVFRRSTSRSSPAP
jgi:hypothetical protein